METDVQTADGLVRVMLRTHSRARGLDRTSPAKSA